jgi:PAS domain S-box-containing protein
VASLQLQLFIEHAPAAIAMFDREMRYLAASRRWLSDHRLRGPVLGRSHYDVLPDIPERWREVHRRALAGEVVSEKADRFDRADGASQWLNWEVRPWQNADGEVGGVVISIEEITERKQMEAALRKSEAEVRLQHDQLDWVYQNTPIGLCLLDRNLRYLRINRQLAEMNGPPVEAHLGRTVAELVPALVERVEQVTQEILATGEAVTDIEFVGETASQPGATRYWNSSWHPVFGDDGAITGFGAVVEEISARRAAEVALRASEERFRGLTQAVPSMTFERDAEGGNTFSSERWSAYSGMTAEESAGAGWTKAVHPEDLQDSAQLWAEALQAGERCEMRHRLRSADGSYRWFLVRMQPQRGREGQILRWAGSCTDIEDITQAEARLRQADKRKDEFLAMLAHELRNPLAPIRNAVSALQRLNDNDPAAKDQARFLIAMVDRQADHLIRLVDDLLEVARITSGKIELKKQHVDLRDTVRQAIETSQPAINAGRHMMTISLPDQPLTVDGDPMRLTQVFANLLNNAAKYTPPEGRIAISMRSDGEEVVASIGDNGIGIRSEILPHIFDLFYQANRTKGREQGGMGIGLALARSLVEMHGGQVEARSDGPGRGSVFVVRLPLAAAPSQDERVEGDATVASVPASHRVLVIDDDRDVGDSLAMLLQLMGADVRVAYDGEAALAVISGFKPHLVLLDIGMPGMNGYETARQIRKLPERQDLILVALSGWGRDEDRRHSAEAGFDHHFVKPMEVDAIENLLASLPTGA